MTFKFNKHLLLGWHRHLYIALLLITSLLFLSIIPYFLSGQGLVQVRNSLIYDVRDNGAYEWTPDDMPSGFILEEAPTPRYVGVRLEGLIGKRSLSAEGSALDATLIIARSMISNQRPGQPVRTLFKYAISPVFDQGLGYCADYAQVLMGMTHSLGIPNRSWAISFKGYSGDGHAFNEIYDFKLKKWVFVDSFYSFYVVDDVGTPLSVLELREALLQDYRKSIRVIKIDPEKFGFKNTDAALSYYRRGMPELYMWWGNNVISYGNNRLVAFAARFSRVAEQAVAILTRVQPRLVLHTSYIDPEGFQILRRLRYQLLSFFFFGCATSVFFVYMRCYDRNNRQTL